MLLSSRGSALASSAAVPFTRRVFSLAQLDPPPFKQPRRPHSGQEAKASVESRTATPSVYAASLSTTRRSLSGSSIARRGCMSPLEAVKQTGLSQLEESTKQIASKTRQRPLFPDDGGKTTGTSRSDGNGPTVRQLRSAAQLSKVLDVVLESYAAKDPSICVRGEPIEVVEVEVNRDLRHARVYWTLPHGTFGEDDPVPLRTVRALTERMQAILDKRRGRIQTLVTARLRRQYPPRIRFVPVPLEDAEYLPRGVYDA